MLLIQSVVCNQIMLVSTITYKPLHLPQSSVSWQHFSHASALPTSVPGKYAFTVWQSGTWTGTTHMAWSFIFWETIMSHHLCSNTAVLPVLHTKSEQLHRRRRLSLFTSQALRRSEAHSSMRGISQAVLSAAAHLAQVFVHMAFRASASLMSN